MSAAAKRKPATKRQAAKKDVVFGLGKTGLSVARYLARNNDMTRFTSTAVSEPPGIGELHEICPDAELHTGNIPRKLCQERGADYRVTRHCRFRPASRCRA